MGSYVYVTEQEDLIMIELRDASLEDVLALAPNIRQADIDEVLAGTGSNIEDALVRSFNESLWTVLTILSS